MRKKTKLIVLDSCNSSSNWRRSLYLMSTSYNLDLSLGSKVLHSISSIESGSNLLILVHKSLKLDVEVSILSA